MTMRKNKQIFTEIAKAHNFSEISTRDSKLCEFKQSQNVKKPYRYFIHKISKEFNFIKTRDFPMKQKRHISKHYNKFELTYRLQK